MAISPVKFSRNLETEKSQVPSILLGSMTIISKFGIGVLIAVVSKTTAQQTVWGQCKLRVP